MNDMAIIHFNDNQKAAIVSLLIEMINVDNVVDPSECDEFDAICAEYGIDDETYRLGKSLNCMFALDMMRRMSDVQKIAVAQLLTRVIDADAKADDSEIRLLGFICRYTGVDMLINARAEKDDE
jgi:uncharacterized tellurite resistance protein B-like protein